MLVRTIDDGAGAVPVKWRVTSHVVGVEQVGLAAAGASHPLPAQVVAGQIAVTKVSDGVQVQYISEDAYAGKPNPHAWMSPEQGLIYVENIRKGLTAQAPQHADYFAERAQAYSDEIRAVDKQLEVALSTLPENNRVLVTCEGAFSYLTTKR